MQLNLEQWVENVKQKPEAVRIRYVVACAGVAMLLVVGVWSLSVSESFRSVSSEAENAATASQGLLPKASNFSLDALLSGEKSLEDRRKEVSGELFFQQQLDSKSQPNFDEEGFVPQNGETEAALPRNDSAIGTLPTN